MDVRMPDGTIIKNVPENITQADLSRRYASYKPPEQAESQPEPEERGFIGSLVRQFGLTARAGIKGIGGALSLPGTIVDAVTPESFPKFRSAELFDRAANGLGLPQPEGAWERVGMAGAEAMAGMGGIGKAAQLVEKGAAPTIRGILGQFSAAPSTLASSAAGAGVGGQIARENDAGPMGQLAASFAGGAAAPASMAAMRGLGGALADIGSTVGASFGHQKSIDRVAREIALNAANGQREQQIAALANRQRDIPGYEPTVPQAIAAANLGKPGQFGGATIRLGKDLSGAQGAQDVLPGHARTQQMALASFKDSVRESTAPMREEVFRNVRNTGKAFDQLAYALGKTNSGLIKAVQEEGKFNTTAAQQEVLAANWNPVLGMPRVSGRYSHNIERVPEAQAAAQEAAVYAAARRARLATLNKQLDTLQASGKSPLHEERILARISEISNAPGNRPSDVIQKTMRETFDKIRGTSNDGRLDPADLYTIRREIGNSISKFSKETQNWDKRLTAGLERDIQRAMDDAIEASGGTGWKDYLRAFSSGMKKAESAEAATAEAKKIALSVKGGPLESVARGEVPQLPTLLSRPMMATNWSLRLFSQRANDPIIKKLAESMTDPEEYMRLLALPPKDPLRLKVDQVVRNALYIDAMANKRKIEQ